MAVDILHTLVVIAGFVCVGVAIVVLLVFLLAARDARDRGRTNYLGGILSAALVGLAAVFFYVAYIP